MTNERKTYAIPNREVRAFPKGWQHPQRDGRYVPLLPYGYAGDENDGPVATPDTTMPPTPLRGETEIAAYETTSKGRRSRPRFRTPARGASHSSATAPSIARPSQTTERTPKHGRRSSSATRWSGSTAALWRRAEMRIDINEIKPRTIVRTRDGNRARVLRPSEDGAFLPVEYLHNGTSDVCSAEEIMSVVAPDNQTRETLEEVLEKMDEIAELLRSLGNARINAYCLAAFEGKAGGWLGQFERDIIEQELRSLDDEDDEE